jgi:lysozyme
LISDGVISRTLAKKPEHAKALVRALASDTTEVQFGLNRQLPTEINVSPLLSLKGGGTNQKRITSDVKLSERALADISAVEKFARNNPSIWDSEFDSINDYLNSVFTANGPQPKEVAPAKETGAGAKTDVVDDNAPVEISVEFDTIRQDEGEVLESYVDTEGHLTGGIGHKLTEEEKKKYPEGTAIPQEVVEKWFEEDTATAKAGAERIIKKNLLRNVPPVVDQVLTEMVFQMGVSGTNEFERMLDSLRIRDYEVAADEILDSDWARQTPERAQRAADRIRALAK